MKNKELKKSNDHILESQSRQVLLRTFLLLSFYPDMDRTHPWSVWQLPMWFSECWLPRSGPVVNLTHVAPWRTKPVNQGESIRATHLSIRRSYGFRRSRKKWLRRKPDPCCPLASDASQSGQFINVCVRVTVFCEAIKITINFRFAYSPIPNQGAQASGRPQISEAVIFEF